MARFYALLFAHAHETFPGADDGTTRASVRRMRQEANARLEPLLTCDPPLVTRPRLASIYRAGERPESLAGGRFVWSWVHVYHRALAADTLAEFTWRATLAASRNGQDEFGEHEDAEQADYASRRFAVVRRALTAAALIPDALAALAAWERDNPAPTSTWERELERVEREEAESAPAGLVTLALLVACQR